MRTVTLHKKDILLNKDKLKYILDSKGMGYVELHDKITSQTGKYGLDITYKGFMSLLSNRSTWKLIYSYAITDVLNVSTGEIFDLVDIDIEKKKREKEEWYEKYGKKKG